MEVRNDFISEVAENRQIHCHFAGHFSHHGRPPCSPASGLVATLSNALQSFEAGKDMVGCKTNCRAGDYLCLRRSISAPLATGSQMIGTRISLRQRPRRQKFHHDGIMSCPLQLKGLVLRQHSIRARKLTQHVNCEWRFPARWRRCE